MQTARPQLILVDGSSYLFRAYHALPPLTAPSGQPTGAIYGAVQMLKRLFKQYPEAQHWAVVFDSKEPTFRHTLLKSYKANRGEMPDELGAQIAPLQTLIQDWGIKLIVMPGVEADDIIGTLCKQAEGQGFNVFIVTNDKDMAQLVNERVCLVDTMRDKILDEAGVFEKFGVHPNQMVDYLALIGDSVDNIKGIPQVGPKTAAKWLQTYGTIEGILSHLSDLKGKVKASLESHQSELALYQRLVRILDDVPIQFEPEAFLRQAPNQTALQKAATQFAFKPDIFKTEHSPVSLAKASISLSSVFATADTIAMVTQYLDVAAKAGKPLSVSFAINSPLLSTQDIQGLAVFSEAGSGSLLIQDPSLFQASVQHLLSYPHEVWMGDVKGFSKLVQFSGLSFDDVPWAQLFDFSIAHYLINSTAAKHETNAILQQHGLNPDCPSLADRVKQEALVSKSIIAQFKQDTDPSIQALYQDVELPLAWVLAKMEQIGVRVDANQLAEQSRFLDKAMQGLAAQAFDLAGETFNLQSPKQLQHILFEKQGLPVLEKTPTGQASTAEPVLQALALQYPLPALILQHRTLAKLKSTYTDKLPLEIHPISGRIHTTYHQTITATGRLSSAEPNLQNIPIRTEEGRKIRKAFIPKAGFSLVSADYSQIELRLMAHFSQDSSLLQAFSEGKDIHQHTASQVFGLPLDQVDSESRRRAKAINFGLLYGMSGYGLSRQLGVSVSEADLFIEKYFAQFPTVRFFMEDTKQFARKNGYVQSLLGRRLYLPEINSQSHLKRKAAERAAINAPLQSTAADVIKQAMCHLNQWLAQQPFEIDLIMQVHDELIFEVPSEQVRVTMPQIKQIMENALPLSVPLTVDIHAGQNWDEAH